MLIQDTGKTLTEGKIVQKDVSSKTRTKNELLSCRAIETSAIYGRLWKTSKCHEICLEIWSLANSMERLFPTEQKY